MVNRRDARQGARTLGLLSSLLLTGAGEGAFGR